MTENRDDHGFDGPWWRYPPLRNALLSSVIAGAGIGMRLPNLRNGHGAILTWLGETGIRLTRQ